MRYRMGDLVEQVTEVNSDLKYGLNDIVGVTLEKQMIPTIANLTQTNLDNFIIVHPKDFVYNPRTHGKKIGLGFNTTDRCFISTWNNNTFRVKPEMSGVIMPEYLYMYFLREKWDKEACFNAWGSSTVVLLWSSFCDMKINVPSLPEQRKIVHDYQVITDRIELLRKMNETLDAIAYTCYKEMLLSEDKSKWHTGTLRELLTVKYGKDHSALADGPFPLYGSGGLMRFVERPLYDKVSVLIPRKGSLNNIMYVDEPFWSVDTMFYTEIANPKAAKFVYFFLRDIDFLGLNTGSAVPSTSSDVIHNMQLEVPPDKDLEKFDDIVTPLFAQIKANNNERDKLKALRVLVSSIVTKGA